MTIKRTRTKSTDVTRKSTFDKFTFSQVKDLMATALMLREAAEGKNPIFKKGTPEIQEILTGLSFVAELLWQSCTDEQIEKLGLGADAGMIGMGQKDGHELFIRAFVEVVDWSDPEAIKYVDLEETLAKVLEVCDSQWTPEKHKLLKEVWFIVSEREITFEAYEAHMSEHFNWVPHGFRADYFAVKDYSVTTALPRLRKEMAAAVVTPTEEGASYANHTNPDGSRGGLVHADATVDPLAYVHESARIEAGAEIGAGVRIEAGAQIAAGAKIQKDSWFATFQVPGVDRPLTAVWTPDPTDLDHDTFEWWCGAPFYIWDEGISGLSSSDLDDGLHPFDPALEPKNTQQRMEREWLRDVLEAVECCPEFSAALAAANNGEPFATGKMVTMDVPITLDLDDHGPVVFEPDDWDDEPDYSSSPAP